MKKKSSRKKASAKKSSTRRTSAGRSARTRPVARKHAAKKQPARKQGAKASSRSSLASKMARDGGSTSPSHAPTDGLYGWITHTELASADPDATRAWCVKALGWTFMPSFPTPDGDYHLFAYSDVGGGGIRRNNPPEVPGTIPYVHVKDAQAAFDKALREGAEEMLAPMKVMEGVTVAIVRAPGGVAIGFSGP